MLARLSTLLLALPFVSALTVNGISGWTTGGTVTLTWSATTQDPSSFSIELVNTAFNNEYAIANNVPTANGQITFQLPQVPPGDGYTINFIAPNNVNQIYASSGSFTIGAATTSSGSASATTVTPTTTASSVSVSATTMASASTPSVSATTPASTVVSPVATTTGTSSAASSTPSSFNSNGAASLKLAGVVPAVALVLSAVAGAVMVF